MKRPISKRWLAPAILAAGLMVTVILVASEEDEIPSGLLKRPLSVETVPAQRQTLRVDIPAWGLVEPREKIEIRPQVQGVIASVAPGLVAGAYGKKNDQLFPIDPRDYEHAYAEARAAYEQARQSLEIEKGQQKIAQAEYKLLMQDSGSGMTSNALALRRPQLKEREAILAMTAAKKDRARLDLERTTLTAPCDGQIMSEAVAIGRYMEMGTEGLTLACTDQYHILASFSTQHLPDAAMKAVQVEIDGKSYPAEIAALLPQIDPDTRKKQVLITLTGMTLPLGVYASVTLKGAELAQVIPLPKAALRGDTTVWILTEENTLDIRPVVLAAQNDKQVIVETGLEPGARVITSHIATPLKGMALRLPEQLSNDFARNTVPPAAGDVK
ncbi:MAG: efflux RND transporter periplasmic adaptor subunit [Alphaproteobacteria bacterium]